MKLFSEKFDETVNVNRIMFDAFMAVAKDTSLFDEDEVNDLLYFSYDIYSAKGSLFKHKFTKMEFLKKIAGLLDYFNAEIIIALKPHEILQLMTASNIHEAFENL
ncbi:MAG: hypothetical protein Q4D02_07055 [Clostridia bacterium]|nr:hypothetical protein [Clostridia bacterium]